MFLTLIKSFAKWAADARSTPFTEHQVSKQHNPFRINVGFIIHEAPGFTRDFEFGFPFLDLSDEFQAKDFTGIVTFSRTQGGLLVETKLSATLATNCVRCLAATLTNVSSDFTELYAFDKRTETENGLFVPESGIIDLEPLVHDYLLLDIPKVPLCKEDCAGLCPECGENRNTTECDCEIGPIDPRLAQLKDLLDE
jgi:uncharacterized protein